MPLSKPETVRLSKGMSTLLRHRAQKEGLPIDEGGFIRVNDLLGHRTLRAFTLEDVKTVAENCPKQRFFMEQRGDDFYIRANQGHSMQNVRVDMEEITDGTNVVAIHGTYFKAWKMIQSQGLSKMGRQHIHLAAGEPGQSGVISGMRHSAQVLIYVDVSRAIADGIVFYRSANNVILTSGNEEGYLLPKYFKRVFDVKKKLDLL